MNRSDPSRKTVNISIIFFFSGIAGLAWQVIWARQLALVFGHTIFAVSTVTATFMAGLAIGGYVFGKTADRHVNPLRLYALLEAGIGFYALAFMLGFNIIDQVYVGMFRTFDLNFSSLSITRFLLAFLLLIIPASMIGGTFPVIVRSYIHQRDQVKSGTGWLYGVNTLGAVCGAVITGFFLLENIGISGTAFAVIGVNLLLSAAAWIVSSKSGGQKAESKPAGKSPYTLILWLYAVSGFVALSLEVLWTRELGIVFLSTTYSFSTVYSQISRII